MSYLSNGLSLSSLPSWRTVDRSLVASGEEVMLFLVFKLPPPTCNSILNIAELTLLADPRPNSLDFTFSTLNLGFDWTYVGLFWKLVRSFSAKESLSVILFSLASKLLVNFFDLTCGRAVAGDLCFSLRLTICSTLLPGSKLSFTLILLFREWTMMRWAGLRSLVPLGPYESGL